MNELTLTFVSTPVLATSYLMSLSFFTSTPRNLQHTFVVA